MLAKIAAVIALLFAALSAPVVIPQPEPAGYPEPATATSHTVGDAPAPEPATATPVILPTPAAPCAGMWIDGYGRWRCDRVPEPFPTAVTDFENVPACNVTGDYLGRVVCDGPAAPILPTPTAAPQEGYPNP